MERDLRRPGLSSFSCAPTHMCALGWIAFLFSAWVFLSVIWGINNWPFLGKPVETIPWKVLVVPVVSHITVSRLQASLGLRMEKMSRPCLTWLERSEPVRFLFSLTPVASCYPMRLSLLTAGPGSSSSEQKWALWTQHFEGSLSDPAGAGPAAFVPSGKRSLHSLVLGKHSAGGAVFPFSQTHV